MKAFVRNIAAPLVALAAFVAPTATAAASSAPHGDARVVGTSAGQVRVLFSATDLPQDARLLPGSVQVTRDGEQLPASATALTKPAGELQRRVMLVLDTSGSMAGAGIDGARQAALGFVRAMPKDVEVGLATFSSHVTIAVRPTRSRPPVEDALRRLSASGETALYDAVRSSLSVLGDSGDRTLIVLSDGADTRSGSSADQVVAAIRHSGARVDAVAFNTADTLRSTLKSFTSAGHGSVYAADSADQLSAAFTAAAQSLVTQLMVTVTIPRGLVGQQVDLHLVVQSTAGPLSDDVTVSLPAPPASPGDSTGSSAGGGATQHAATPVHSSKKALWLALAALTLGAILLLYLLITNWFMSRSGSTKTKQLAEMYTVGAVAKPAAETDEDASKLGSTSAMKSALAVTERLLDRPGYRERVELRLARANVALRANEWLLVQAGVAFVAGLLVGLVARNLLGFVIGAIIGYFATVLWLAFKCHRRLTAFEERLPESLQLVAGSLSSGFSLPQAIDAVVRDGQPPVSEEFGRALAEARLGIPIEDCLDRVAYRMTSTDFRWVVMAIRIQREVGGNLAELLSNTAAMMRERARIHRQVRALSAEGRLSAYILVGLPIVMSLYLLTFRRHYIRVLYTDPIGIGLLVTAILLVGCGALWMRNLVRIEV